MLLMIGGAIAVDRVSPAKPVPRSTVSLAPEAGILTCPYLTEPNARSYLQVANIGTTPSSIRVNFGAAKGAPIVVPLSVLAGETGSIRIPSTAASRAGAVVEFSGGNVVATHMLFLQKVSGPVVRAGGAAASPCARAGGEDVVVTGASTLGSDAELALYNPGAADADVSVSLIPDGRGIRAGTSAWGTSPSARATSRPSFTRTSVASLPKRSCVPRAAPSFFPVRSRRTSSSPLQGKAAPGRASA